MLKKDNHSTPGAHASAPPGSLIAGRYEVVCQAGTGNFARVFECLDKKTNRHVAVKLLKRGFERDADFECDILRGINKHDPKDDVNIVKLIEKTTWNGIATIVFNLKGAPLKASNFPFDHRSVARVAYDIGKALSFLHFTVRAVHTDLKPENILAEKAGSSNSACWSICDLGSASFYSSRLDTDLITTRPYRAPEVVLNKGWSYPADTWSLGCILYEIRTNKKLFDCHTDGDHIAMMTQRLGPIPGHLTRISTTRTYPLIRDELRHEDPDFLNLLLMMLIYDPAKRIKASEIVQHPYVVRQMENTKAPVVPIISRTATSKTVSTEITDTNALSSITQAMAEMEIKVPVRRLTELKPSLGNIQTRPEAMRQKSSLIATGQETAGKQNFRLNQK